MAVHFYLSLIPEALIASMLTPEEFGTYYAVGIQKKSRGQAIFFEVDPKFKSDAFRLEEAIAVGDTDFYALSEDADGSTILQSVTQTS